MDTKDAGRLGGKAKSEKKAIAVRKNGKKGGRPQKCKELVLNIITGTYQTCPYGNLAGRCPQHQK